MSRDWRFAVLGGASAGLGLSPFLAAPPLALVALASAVPLLIKGRRRLAAIALAACLGGALLGSARLEAIDGGAFEGPRGKAAEATGYAVAVPRRVRGEVRVEVETTDGKLLVAAREPVPEFAVGEQLRATGMLTEPDPFIAPLLRRRGITAVLAAERVEPTGAVRGGVAGLLDGVRSRAEAALERGMREPEAALARGFVLGEDDRIDPRTIDDFKRSGLAHLLAVSGQNVVLLALLAIPILALAGISLRARLICILVLIAVYVPVAGGGPSIQRAGVMGAAGLVAALAGRPRSRAYAVLLAAFATLALNPRASGEIGWQLSFAAVIGIFLWSGRLAALIGAGDRQGMRRALAEGAAMSVAATLATAPLMAHHFEQVSLAALPANLLALPAVAPAMWLGMLSGALGQFPVLAGAAVPLNAVNELLLAYVEQVARWFAQPSWAVAELRLGGPAAVVAAYAALLAAASLALRTAERRRELGLPRPRVARLAPVAVAAVALVLLLAPRPASPGGADKSTSNLRVSVLDVGQGDAILIRPPGSGAVLVDGGPPGGGIAALLDERVDSLQLAVVSHDSSDHSGGVLELLGRTRIGTLAAATAGPELLGAAAAAGVPVRRLSEGSVLRSGELRLEVLWPPRELLPPPPGSDENATALVIRAEWRHFSILLTADAEAELVPVEPGPVDVLKVAHHGSADQGLDRLLDQALPDLAVIPVGADNSYGHPAPETLAELDGHRVPVLRTDERGTIEIEASPGGWTVNGSG